MYGELLISFCGKIPSHKSHRYDLEITFGTVKLICLKNGTFWEICSFVYSKHIRVFAIRSHKDRILAVWSAGLVYDFHGWAARHLWPNSPDVAFSTFRNSKDFKQNFHTRSFLRSKPDILIDKLHAVWYTLWGASSFRLWTPEKIKKIS